jgi:hypothetical protein
VTLAFTGLKSSIGVVSSVAVVGSFVLSVAVISLFLIEETFGKDLDYLEKL